MKNKSILQLSENIKIDHATGEIIQSEKVVVQRINYDDYAKIYFNDVGRLLGLEAGELKVLIACGQLSEYNTGKLYLLKHTKQGIADATDLKIRTINNIIVSLTKKGILKHIDNSVYILNPEYFWKGSEVERSKTLRFVLEYRVEMNTSTNDPNPAAVSESA